MRSAIAAHPRLIGDNCDDWDGFAWVCPAPQYTATCPTRRRAFPPVMRASLASSRRCEAAMESDAPELGGRARRIGNHPVLGARPPSPTVVIELDGELVEALASDTV